MRQKPFPTGKDPATPLSRHGLVTTAELLASGLGHGAIWKRARRGALHRRYHGVYSLSPGALSREGEWMAALLAAGPGSVLSHLSAATLWRAWRYLEQAIDVLIPRRHVPIPGLRLRQYRALHPSDVYVHEGIRVTTVARTLVDLTDVLTSEELTNVINEAAFRRRFSLQATRRAMIRANGRHHLDVLERALEHYLAGSAGLKSRKERAFLALLKSAGIALPRVNTKVLSIEVDFHWPTSKLVVEVDGNGHDRPPAQRDDARRDARLSSAGWTVLRFTDEAIERQPDQVLAAVACALRRRS